MDFESEYSRLLKMFEAHISEYFTDDCPQKNLCEAMRYSLLAGGKRLRPVMLLKFCEACGGSAESALPFAAAVEMAHTYSLIHDDMPCMDNDDLRRGKSTNHKVFGEWTAMLAGDALQAAAFDSLLRAPLPSASVCKAGRVLAEAAGVYGMCGGQQLDMEGEEKTLDLDGVSAIHERKTAAMIKAAAKMGVIAGGGNEIQLMIAELYAGAIGLAFQIKDDILDMISTPEEMGKSVGSDEKSGKSTFASLYGIERCQEIVNEKTDEAKSVITAAFSNSEFFFWLADMLAGRKN